MNIALIIAAAGRSTRFSREAGDDAHSRRSKLDEYLCDRPVLHRTVEAFANYTNPDGTIDPILVAGPHDEQAFEAFKLRHGDKLAILGIKLVRGGPTHRWETIKAALAHVPDTATHIAVHDAARPCISTQLLDRLVDAAARFPAVVPGLPLTDTIKRTSPEPLKDETPDPLAAILGNPDEGAGIDQSRAIYAITETIDRERVVAVQTPQIFQASLLRKAYAQRMLSGTDDASLVEQLGEQVVVVPGDAANIKITRPLDLQLACAILNLSDRKSRPAHKRF